MTNQTTVNANDPAASVPERRFWMALVVLIAARLVYIWILPFDLVGDEAYYWDWGRHPDWGYFSKPPLIGWLMGLASWFGGGTVLGLRAAALLLGAGSLILTFALARDLYGGQVAFWAAAAVAATPGNAVSNLLLTIDAPLIFFWCAALFCLWRAVSARSSPLIWILLLVTAVGLGLLSKQMIIVFPIVTFIFLACDPGLRRHLARPWYYLGVAGALSFLIPVVVWNSLHHWVTFTHTAGHFRGRSHDLVKIIGRFFSFIGSQMGLTSPILWVLMMTLFLACLPAFRKLARKERFLFLFSGPALLVMTMMTVNQRINPNWPAVYYPAGFILLTGWAFRRFELSRVSPRLRRFFKPGVLVGAILSLTVYTIPFILPFTDIPGSSIDPTRRLRGWRELGAAVGELRTGMPDTEKTFIVALGHHYNTSELAFYTPGRPPVYRWTGSGHIECQYEFWPGPDHLSGWDALVVIPGLESELPSELAAGFRSVDSPHPVRIPLGPVHWRDFTVYPAHQMIHWPKQGDHE